MNISPDSIHQYANKDGKERTGDVLLGQDNLVVGALHQRLLQLDRSGNVSIVELLRLGNLLQDHVEVGETIFAREKEHQVKAEHHELMVVVGRRHFVEGEYLKLEKV